MRLDPAASLRGKLLAIVVSCAVLPLALLALWLTRGAARAGEALLRAQLDSSLVHIAGGVDARWALRRSDLLLLADNAAVEALSAPPGSEPAPPAYLTEAFGTVDPSVVRVVYRDLAGRPRWRLPSAAPAEPPRPPDAAALPSRPALRLVLPVHDGAGRRIGTMEAFVRAAALIPGDAGVGGVGGAVLSAYDASGQQLLGESATRAQLRAGRFTRNGAGWVATRRRVAEPALELFLAAPAAPYVAPFRDAARLGLVVLLLVLGAALLLTGYWMGRVTRSLRALSSAAAAVTAGDLGSRVDVRGRDEVARVAGAFNTMTESLRRTLGELSRREALAAVGEFAASLSHEVRNSLTSVRVDLQRAEEKVPAGEAAHALVARALRKVSHLDASVTGALRVARAGTVERRPTDLAAVVAAAAHAAEPEFDARGVALVQELPEEPSWVEGDDAALEHLALNLLLNAAQATPAGGVVRAAIERREDGWVLRVADSGPGIDRESAAGPPRTTKARGTGLGLSIARRLAAAHGSELRIDSSPVGTTIQLALPATDPTVAVSRAPDSSCADASPGRARSLPRR